MTSDDRHLLILRRLDEIERKLDRTMEELRTPISGQDQSDQQAQMRWRFIS
jgi:hypothetical protein